MSGSDRVFIWLFCLIIFAVFLFGGEPDLNDALIVHLTGDCPIVEVGPPPQEE